MKFEDLVAAFLRRWGPILQDPVKAHDRCVPFCEKFLEGVRLLGMNAQLISGVKLGNARSYGFAHNVEIILRGHFAVLIGDMV
jgi:hypothetical protein